MINPFRPLGAAMRDLFDEVLLLGGCNLLWCLICLPLLWAAYLALSLGAPVAAACLAMLAVLPAGPATAALTYVAQRVSEGRATKLGEFFGALRRYARASWALLAIWMGGLLIILFDIGFYAGVGNFVGALVLGLWAYLLLMWLALLIYIFPLLIMQEQFSLRQIARNALLMVLGRPIFTLLNLALMLVLLGLATYLVVPVVLIGVALLNIWSLRATRTLIEDAQRRREAAAGLPTAPAEERGRRGQVRPK
jgi:uncharacterized membrane protein YesL